eukprot:m.78026 g.78026  ORF g.78026 m.78026 type:complete len:442 (-) comp25070_c0_seq2:321-1646(-)
MYRILLSSYFVVYQVQSVSMRWMWGVVVLGGVLSCSGQLLLNADINVYGKVPRKLSQTSKMTTDDKQTLVEAMPKANEGNSDTEVNPTSSTPGLPQNHPDVAGGESCPSTGLLLPTSKDASCDELFESGQWEKALTCYEKDPKSTSGSMDEVCDLLERRAEIHMLLDAPKQAIALLEDASKLRAFVGGESVSKICDIDVNIAHAAEMAKNWSYARRKWEAMSVATNCGCDSIRHIDTQAVAHQRLGMFAHHTSTFGDAIDLFAKSMQAWRECAQLVTNDDDHLVQYREMLVATQQAVSLLESGDADAAGRVYTHVLTTVQLILLNRDDTATDHITINGVTDTISKASLDWQSLERVAMAGVVASNAVHGSCGDTLSIEEHLEMDFALKGQLFLLSVYCTIACDTEVVVIDELVQAIKLTQQSREATLHPVMVTAKRILKEQ